VRYAFKHDIPARFMDLPQTHALGLDVPPAPPDMALLQQMAQVAGYQSYETWWHMLVEQRFDDEAVFPAILEMMSALREADQARDTLEKAAQNLPAEHVRAARAAAQREGFMRHAIRAAYSSGYQRIAVVCGAWHAPALRDLGQEAADDTLLAGLPQVLVETAWVPWTYSRLHIRSGYGAGIHSPGWYHHLWTMNGRRASATDIAIEWLTKVAGLLRTADLDASAAHVIAAVRLSAALAAMRERPFPGLEELNEATQTILCFGDPTPLQLIRKQLIVSERMGRVPADIPLTPLQKDVYATQRELALPSSPEKTKFELDLRRPQDLARSHFLHRLGLLGIPWGKTQRSRGQQGTFQEVWQLQWQPNFTTHLIEASVWGNILVDAAMSKTRDAADKADTLSALTKLLDQIILADLGETISYLMQRVEDESALSSDIPHMMDALPPLARVLRYGDVRQTDRGMIQQVVEGLFTRICVGLPTTCAALDERAATELLDKLNSVQHVIDTLDDGGYRQQWRQTLATIADQPRTTALLAGRACRLLFDTGYFGADAIQDRMSRALLLNHVPPQNQAQLNQMAHWLEGFFKGSGLLLVHDRGLWQLLDQWVTKLADESFVAVLPLLRRTFATFTSGTRQQLAEQMRYGVQRSPQGAETPMAFDPRQANRVLPALRQIFNLPPEETPDALRS
jgi:hypothetical protein